MNYRPRNNNNLKQAEKNRTKKKTTHTKRDDERNQKTSYIAMPKIFFCLFRKCSTRWMVSSCDHSSSSCLFGSICDFTISLVICCAKVHSISTDINLSMNRKNKLYSQQRGERDGRGSEQ